MPFRPSFKTSSIRSLFEQLRFAPAETTRRILTAAETLVEEIDPDRAYPEDFIAFRITGFRSEAVEEPAMLVGGALLADLATFVQGLSREIALAPVCRERGRALDMDEVAQTLNVSVRTLRRYRRRGLILHYVTFEDGQRLACYESMLQRFRARESDVVDRAKRFSRINAATEQRLIEEAIALADGKRSRQEIARQLAEKHDRAVETIRGILARYEDEHGGVFRGRRRTPARERALIWRAWRLGASPARISTHLGRSPQTIRRAVNQQRAQRLADLTLSSIALPTFSRPDADEILLSSESVRVGLGPWPQSWDAIELIEKRRAPAGEDTGGIDLRIAAFNFLKHRATEHIKALDQRPGDAELDRIETDLRWAALLKRRLVYEQLPDAFRCIQQHLGRDLLAHRAETIRAMISLAVREIAQTTEQVDLNRNQKVRRLSVYAVERALARKEIAPQPGRAAARHEAGAIPLGDPFAALCPWQEWTELKPIEVERVENLAPDLRAIVQMRWGVAEEAPHTVGEIVEKMGLSLRAVLEHERKARRRLRQ